MHTASRRVLSTVYSILSGTGVPLQSPLPVAQVSLFIRDCAFVPPISHRSCTCFLESTNVSTRACTDSSFWTAPFLASHFYESKKHREGTISHFVAEPTYRNEQQILGTASLTAPDSGHGELQYGFTIDTQFIR